MNERFHALFREYAVVGGMPAVVQRYLDTHDISAVVAEQKSILVEYRKDITKYDKKNALRIREAHLSAGRRSLIAVRYFLAVRTIRLSAYSTAETSTIDAPALASR